MANDKKDKNNLPFIGDFFVPEHQQQILDKPSAVQKHPAMYKVILLNDDFTPMDFVTLVLKRLFHKSQEDAVRIMLQTHSEGEGECGVFTRDVAETKVIQVINFARENNYPLKCVIHKEYAVNKD